MRAHIKFPGKWVQLVILTTFNGSLILGDAPVFAGPIPLIQATLRKVVNRVDLIPFSQSARSAKVNDRLSKSGDAIKTQRASRTELKFNDGTLAKVGELATFRFTPNTRRFELGNGTYLFLVPPGRGNTEFNTPNAKAGIRGSALFIRYIEESDTTIMGALTNNPLGPMDITVGGKKQDLYAGQMVVAIKDRIDRVETFDLTTFFQTSPMYRDIDFMDPDLQEVRQEMADAVTTQVAAIGTLPTQVETAPQPRIFSDPTSSIPKRESTEAREILNDPNRNQPIVEPSPPNIIDPPVVEPPIVRPSPPNIIAPPIVKPDPNDAIGTNPIGTNPIGTGPITTPPIAEVPIVKPIPPNIKDPSPIVPPTGSNPGIPIIKPTPPNIKNPGQHQYIYITVYVNGKPFIYLQVDGKIDYSRVIEFVRPAIATPAQPAPVAQQLQPAPIATPAQPPTVAPIQAEPINVRPIQVIPLEPSKLPVETIPVREIKPDIKVLVDIVKPAIETIKAPVNLIKFPIDIANPTIEPIKPPLDLIKAPIEIKPAIEPIKPPLDLIKAPIEIKPTIEPIKLPVEIGKPPIEVTSPVIVPDVIKVAPAALTDPGSVALPVTPPITNPPVTPPITAPLVTIPPITSPIITPPVTPIVTPPVTLPITNPPVTPSATPPTPTVIP